MPLFTAYVALWINVISVSLLSHSINAVLVLITLCIAYATGALQGTGLAALCLFWLLSELSFRSALPAPLRKTLFFFVLLFAALLAAHKIPGFHNLLVLQQVTLSPLSCPFTMYLNVDKTIMGIILALACGTVILPTDIKRFFVITLLTLSACIAVMMAIAVTSRYVAFDPKFPASTLLFSWNNLFFVCFAEEVLFRGVIQQKLSEWTSRRGMPEFIALFLASLIFGLAHYKGGAGLVVFAALAGMFYGYAYVKTRALLSSILVHFGLNAAHFLLFTYPAALHNCH